MAADETDERPAAWYDDPEDASQYRYWDGERWTEHRSSKQLGESQTDSTADAASSDERDGAGHGEFGDGIERPLYEFRASRWKGGRPITPNVIRVWPDRVEEYSHHAIRKKGTNSIHWARVAQVSVRRGLRWSDLRVESTGGHVITIVGMRKAEADRVKGLVDAAVIKAVEQLQSTPQVVVHTASEQSGVDVADQLRKLADLRNEGILTDAEFEAQKARLLTSG